MIRKLLASIFLFLFTLSATAFGQLKVGYMNTQEVLNQVPERSQVQQELNSFIQSQREQLEQKTAAFQDSVAEYQQNQSDLSTREIEETEQRLTKMQSSMRQFQQSIQQKIQRRRAELLQPLYNRMDKAIAVVAEEKDLDFVLNEATNAGENVIYYSDSEKLDITDEVLRQMNKTTSKN